MSDSGFYCCQRTNFTRKKKKKNFSSGYVGSFYRNLADKVDDFVGSDL